MSTIYLGKIKKYLPILQTIILALGTIISFIISYEKGFISPYLPFVSETGAYSPAQCIFSLSLIFGSFIGCVMIFFIYMIISSVSQNRVNYCFNKVTCIIGIISMVGLAGVAAFPMTTVFWAHLVAATLYFLGSAIYFICMTFITFKLDGRSKLTKIRFILSGAITICLLFIMVFFPISLKNWYQKNDIIAALKTPDHEGFGLLVVSSVLEWSIVFIMIAFNVSLLKELSSKTVILMIPPEECKMNPSPENLPENNENPHENSP